ncbi:hypothetical protein EMPS_01531 [Entomortierella parvispora]|uniref:CDC20/Fizzy WD40 domain-containing protein n=1 Tax=Entomortierella parvispora TaxID=205924 RepID=A0A9P3H372_9FUNG|nr:hypothetical protein EMPS_01531 [Entomortierella parvispora]
MSAPSTPARNRPGSSMVGPRSPLTCRSPSALNQSPVQTGPGSLYLNEGVKLVLSPSTASSAEILAGDSGYLPPLEQLLQGESKRKERELQRAQSKSRLGRINSLKPGGFKPFSELSASSASSASESALASASSFSTPSSASLSSNPSSSSSADQKNSFAASVRATLMASAASSTFAPVSLPRVPRQPSTRQSTNQQHSTQQPQAHNTQASIRAALLGQVNAPRGQFARSNISNPSSQRTGAPSSNLDLTGKSAVSLRGSGRGFARSMTTSLFYPRRSETIAEVSTTILGKRPVPIPEDGDTGIVRKIPEIEEDSPFNAPETTQEKSIPTARNVDSRCEEIAVHPPVATKRLRRAMTTTVISVTEVEKAAEAAKAVLPSEPVNKQGLTLKQQGQMSLLDLVPGGHVDHTQQVVKHDNKTLPTAEPKSEIVKKGTNSDRYIPLRPDPERARYHMESKHSWKDYADVPYIPSDKRNRGGFRSPSSVGLPSHYSLRGCNDTRMKKSIKPRSQLTDTMTQVHNDMIAEVSNVDFRGRLFYFSKEQEESERARMPPTTLKRYQSYKRLISTSSRAKELDQLQSWRRAIRPEAQEILDAPNIPDDFYTSLLDWSNTGRLAVAVGRDIFVRDPSRVVTSLMRCPLGPTGDDYLTAVKWSDCGGKMAYGTDKGDVLVREVETGINLLKLGNRRARVSVLSWNNDLVYQGFRSGGLRLHDIRIPLERTGRVRAHDGVVCGMAWNQDGIHLATGGNDNLVKVWDSRKMTHSLLTLKQHEAAIKALAWCPYGEKILATGGGSQDRKIYFWDTSSVQKDGECQVIDALDAEHAVTSIQFSKEYEEFAVSHGPELSLYTYPKLATQAETNGPHHNFANSAWSHHFSGPGASQSTIASTSTSTFHDFEHPKFKRFFHNSAAHQSRILHSTMSPDGVYVATVAADCDLKMWRLFEPRTDEENKRLADLLGPSFLNPVTSSSMSFPSSVSRKSPSKKSTRKGETKDGAEERDSDDEIEDFVTFDKLRKQLR